MPFVLARRIAHALGVCEGDAICVRSVVTWADQRVFVLFSFRFSGLGALVIDNWGIDDGEGCTVEEDVQSVAIA